MKITPSTLPLPLFPKHPWFLPGRRFLAASVALCLCIAPQRAAADDDNDDDEPDPIAEALMELFIKPAAHEALSQAVPELRPLFEKEEAIEKAKTDAEIEAALLAMRAAGATNEDIRKIRGGIEELRALGEKGPQAARGLVKEWMKPSSAPPAVPARPSTPLDSASRPPAPAAPAQPEWQAGRAHSTLPHVRSATKPGRWEPALGYHWRNDLEGDYSVEAVPLTRYNAKLAGQDWTFDMYMTKTVFAGTARLAGVEGDGYEVKGCFLADGSMALSWPNAENPVLRATLECSVAGDLITWRGTMTKVEDGETLGPIVLQRRK